MRKGTFFIALMLWGLLCSIDASGQNFEYVYRNPADSSFNCYLKILPKGEIKGMVVRDYSSLPKGEPKSRYNIMNLCLENGFIYLLTNTSNLFPELFLDEAPMVLLDQIIQEVVEGNKVPKENIFIGGISASGTRALRFTQFCEQGKSKFGLKIAGAFVCDSPLDNERFYRSAKDILERNHPKGMNEEANWMLELYPKYLGGGPDEYIENYRKASVFSATDKAMTSAKDFNYVPIILFHEADMNWWTYERNATYSDINAVDHVGFARALNNVGNEDVTLIETMGKGFDKQGNRNCHSWTIVDEELLMQWIIKRSK
ncbi:MAG: hypothetical protein CL840_16840 [Crocinitomicaceae bacterium]|nr:hypothetical protein [Crocinitomicaceae bacterium]|tara:strand:+ start:3878 stop:4822 length:945 start_codon:yes stop_codon:yes gene_type:complete